MTTNEEKKPRTTSQLWSRREKIQEKIAELQREENEITQELKDALDGLTRHPGG